MRRKSVLKRVLIALLVTLLPASRGAGAGMIDAVMHHLGKAREPEWQEFASDPAQGLSLSARFRASPNAREATLLVRQRDVKLDWDVKLNGRSLGKLSPAEVDLVHALAVPAGALRDGENVIEIGPASGLDDIVVGEIELDLRPKSEALGRATLNVQVTDADSGRPIPCRITIVDDRNVLVPLHADADPKLAVRSGVAYTASGQARLGLRPGRYTVHATRGFEYGLASRTITLDEGSKLPLALAIRREVPTPGLVACDTHVHTLTFSGHGDATLDERLVTLAGEGIELPVATDHNHLTDLDPAARRLGIRSEFTPIIGDEVTTRRGHFNAFPFAAGGSVPDARIEDWPALMREIRNGSSGRIIVLNHPQGVHSDFRPFASENFNAATGEDRRGVAYGFDAIELINSGAMQSDPMLVVRDWFALWNHGQQVTAVGASDSHDVNRFIVGQGRTYVACRDDDPGRIDVAEASQSLRAGRALVSLGLLAHLTVDDRFHAGDLATGLGSQLRATVTVLGPSWVRADRVELFANGSKIREQTLDATAKPGEKARIEWTLPRPSRDLALVAVASGPGVTAPYWPIPRPYQPASKAWTPRVLAVTNPVRIDADGNAAWSSPRDSAQFVIELAGTEPSALFKALAPYDEAVAVQTAALCLPPTRAARDPAFMRALESAPEAVRRGFAAYEATLGPEKPSR